MLGSDTKLHPVYQVASCDCSTCGKPPNVFVSPGGVGTSITMDALLRSSDSNPVPVPAPVPNPWEVPAPVPVPVARP